MHEALTIVSIVGGWAAILAVVSVVLSRLGGWAALAQQYGSDEPFPATSWKFQRAQFRWFVGYNNCLTLGADRRGLYISTFFLFRIAHPPLFIPWREISVSSCQSLWVKQVRFHAGREMQIPITIGESLAQKLQSAAGGSWPAETDARGPAVSPVRQ